MIFQGCEVQIDAAHRNVGGGSLHGHTWFIRVERRLYGDFIPDVIAWREQVRITAQRFDHRRLSPGESLAEQLAQTLGAALHAYDVEVWRFIDGQRVWGRWRAE